VQRGLPEAVQSLVASLLDLGFREVRNERSESFGNRLIEFAASDNAVRVIRDRDEWRSEISWFDEWWDPEVLVAAAHGRDAGFVGGFEDDPAALASLRDRTLEAVSVVGEPAAGDLIAAARAASSARGDRVRQRLFPG
jgi:hypothetical protein